MDPEPDLELSEKSDPDPEIIFSAPTHCLESGSALIPFLRSSTAKKAVLRIRIPYPNLCLF